MTGAWHTEDADKIFRQFGSRPDGLQDKEAKERILTYGPNKIDIVKKTSALELFINQFKNLLVLLLLLAAIVSLGISLINPAEADIFDAILIFAIVIANALFGFFQEYKAEKTIEELTKMAAPKATVIREGRELEIPSEDVVPGDVLVLIEGDKVAADAYITEAFSLYGDESMLTGESMPSTKRTGKLPEKTILAERTNMVFMNSVITRGRGMAVVVGTGIKTEVGKIAKDISEAPDKVTQFQVEIADIGKKVSIITLIILVIIAGTKFMMGEHDLLALFMTSVALGVAAIPEGLPAVVTLTLSLATNRMLKQNALMRRLSTIQDLGSIDTICSDKTGTLTENMMTVTRIYVDGERYDVSGKGVELSGEISPIPRAGSSALSMILRCAVFCNDARMVEEEVENRSEGKKHFRGDPTEIAILIPAYKLGFDVDELRKEWKRISEIPFSAERKMMSTQNRPEEKEGKDGKGSIHSFVKGAPEVVLTRCTHISKDGKITRLADAERTLILENIKLMASDALRVLAFAYKENPVSEEEKDCEDDLVFLGMMGMMDPPRHGVKQAIMDCRSAGIRVIMITGDNGYTAEAVGRELGFSGNAVSGEHLDAMDDAELSITVEGVDIYARTSPKHKVRILKALQANRHIVCMTGDGVNDAAAIKNSDVGIAMGIRGTEVTKQASDIIVLDDNFVTIRNAIREGRGTFDNIRKFVAYLLGANVSEVLIIFIAAILGLAMSPKLAVQLLWINLITDGLPALALGADKPAKDIMDRKPRLKSERMLDRKTLYFLVSIGISATVAILAVYINMLNLGNAALAQTVLFTTFVLMEMQTVYIVRWHYKTDLLSNKWLHLAVASSIILQLVLIYSPAGAWFGTVPLGIGEIEEIVASMVIYMVLLIGLIKLEPLLLPKAQANHKG